MNEGTPLLDSAVVVSIRRNEGSLCGFGTKTAMGFPTTVKRSEAPEKIVQRHDGAIGDV
jgi:hypothetical protein